MTTISTPFRGSLVLLLALGSFGSFACTEAERPADAKAPPAAEPAKGAAQATSATDGDKVAAVVGDEEITIQEIDARIEPQLARLDMQRYQARKQALDQMIQQKLVEARAAEVGVSPQDLATTEVAEKVEPPTDEEVKAYYERYKDRLQGDYEALAPRIRQSLFQQAAGARQQDYLKELRDQAKVEVRLEPPRIEVATTGGIGKGDPNAPITLIEFSDYQCPFCLRSQEAVKAVLEKYGDKVYHVFMDFPLTQIHPQAVPAAVAARCAGEQDKFWEYHDILFERQRDLSEENYVKWAGELDLDQEKFRKCLEGGDKEQLVQQNQAIGSTVGVSGTPAFFLNGIMISGAQPFEVFEETIESELERAPS